MLILNQFLNGSFYILALREDEILELRGVADEGVGRADACDGSVEVFEKFILDAGRDLGAVAVRDRIFVGDDDAGRFLDGCDDRFPIVRDKRAEIDDLD